LAQKQIKMIRRGHYSSNNFQDSTKEKLLKENMGYLPRVLFFNAFELGPVILKDAHVSARKELEAKESIKKQIQNAFKSNPLPMKKNHVKK
jgi:hypothetical protein